MKCLVIGAGGVGGSLAALLALAGNEVTCVARGEHKEKMLAHGLRFHSGIKGEQVVPCYVYDGTGERPGEIGVATTETYRGEGRADIGLRERVFRRFRGGLHRPCLG